MTLKDLDIIGSTLLSANYSSKTFDILIPTHEFNLLRTTLNELNGSLTYLQSITMRYKVSSDLTIIIHDKQKISNIIDRVIINSKKLTIL